MTDDTQISAGDTGSHTANSLGLSVPAQGPAPADSFLLDARETAAWVSSLPMANIGETSRQVYRTLVDFNRYQLPEMLRAKQVEQFRQPVDYICSNLLRHYMDMGFPLSDKAWKTAVLSRELNAELAISYKTIVERMLAGEADRFDRKLLVIALHRALYYLGRVMLQTTLIYSPWPRNMWKELNTLFAFAQQNRVHQVPIKMKLDDKEDISTIEDNYKALLLLAASTPYRIRQNHLIQLYEETRIWAHSTELGMAEHDTSTTGQFNINLLADEPPVHNALRPAESGRHVLVLDVRNLLKRIREDFEQAPLETHIDVHSKKRLLGRPLLRQLLIAWNHPPERRYVRTRLNFELNVLCGLQPIYESIAEPIKEPIEPAPQASHTNSSGSPFAGGVSSPSPYSLMPDSALGNLSGDNLSLAPLGSGTLGGDSLSNDSYLNIEPGSNSELNDDWLDEPLGDNSAKHHTSLVTTRNESAGGYCIHWSSAENIPKVKVGELVGIASATQHRQYSLGVVRWMRLHGGQELDLGLQVISNTVEAAQLRAASTKGARRTATPPVNCLLLRAAANDPNSDVASIVLNNVSFPVGTNLWLSQGSRKRMIRLTKLVEFSSAFAQFQFAYTGDETESDPSEDTGKTRFDDLWNNL